MTSVKSIYKNINGVYLMRELFYETAGNRDNVLYTLKMEDYEGYPSLHRLYLEVNDPTEYLFANKYFFNWDHWKTVSSATFMGPIVQKMREELEIRFRSAALASIMEKAAGSSREAFQAAKYVAEGWGQSQGTKRAGRPSKADIATAAKDHIDDKRRLEEDFLRLVK